MSKLFSLYTLGLGIGLALSPIAFAESPETALTVDPVVQISAPDATSPADFKGYCTGFYIGQGRVVTAGHCAIGDVDKAVTLLFTQSDGQVLKQSGRVIAWGHPQYTYDYAVIQTSDVNAPALGLNCSQSLNVGDSVSMTGYPLGGPETTVVGKVSTKPYKLPVKVEARQVQGVNIASVGGFSGSPVFGTDGLVAGIMVAGFPSQPSLALILPIGEFCPIKALLDD